MEATIYNQVGKSVGTVTLPESVFSLKWNADLVHQVITSEMSSKRTPIAHTKDRSEVRGGGKKPWQQKGTGRARHGSSRSPIWVGGGVAHGPRNDKNYDRKVNKKMKSKALLTIIARKYKDGEVVFVDKFAYDAPKTKYAKAFFDSFKEVKGLEKLSSKGKNRAYLALSSGEAGMKKSFSNFSNIEVVDFRNMNPVDISNKKFLIITNPEAALKALAAKIEKTPLTK